MKIGSAAELDQLSTGPKRFDGESDVLALVAGLDEGIQGGEQGEGDGLELGVGNGERGFEGIDVGEEGAKVVDCHDEVLVVGPTDVLDFGLFGSGEVSEVVKQSLWLAGGEGLADEGT